MRLSCFFLFALFAASQVMAASPSDSPSPLPDGLYAKITTPRGTIIARLFDEDAPVTVTNFVGLAEGTLGPNPGKPFYDGLTFHRVVPGFVIQGGDPLARAPATLATNFPMNSHPNSVMTPSGYYRWRTPDRIPTAANSSSL